MVRDGGQKTTDPIPTIGKANIEYSAMIL